MISGLHLGLNPKWRQTWPDTISGGDPKCRQLPLHTGGQASCLDGWVLCQLVRKPFTLSCLLRNYLFWPDIKLLYGLHRTVPNSHNNIAYKVWLLSEPVANFQRAGQRNGKLEGHHPGAFFNIFFLKQKYKQHTNMWCNLSWRDVIHVQIWFFLGGLVFFGNLVNRQSNIQLWFLFADLHFCFNEH